MTKTIRLTYCFFLSFSLLIASISQARSLTDEAKAPVERPKILVLDSYPRGMPIPESINRGILAALKEKSFSVADVFIENLDSARTSTSDHRINFVNLLRHKLSEKRIGTVITIGPLATDFIAKEGKDLFPNAAVLALISPNYQNLSTAYARVMNIPWQVDPAGTLDVALDLFPETRQVFVVTGANDSVLPFLDEAKKAFGLWDGKLTFEYSNDMTYEKMLRRVSSLPKNTVIIYAPFFSDSTGRTFVPAEVVVTVCNTANSPVFATLEEYLGSGIIGGSLLRTEGLGKSAAMIALDYLSGQLKLTKPETTFASTHRVAFDWRELIRWNLDHVPRPDDSIIINRPQTLWGQYKIPVIAGVITVLFLSALLIALLLFNRRLQRAKGEITASEERFRVMIERAPEAIILYDVDLKRIVESNPKAEQLFGCSQEQLGQGGLDRFFSNNHPAHDDVIASMDSDLSRAMAGEELAFEQPLRSNDGRDLVCKVRIVRLPHQNKRLLRGSFIDITERKREHAELEASRAEFAAIFNSISDGIVFVDAQRRIVRINPAFTSMLGYQLSEIAGQTPQLIYADQDHYLRQGLERFNIDAKVDRPVFENEYRRKDGTTFPGETIGVHVVDETGQLLGYIAVIHDVSERKSADRKRERLEGQLHQSQKIESLGRLAGGVAHDYNNMLSVIMGHAELAQIKAKRAAPLNDNLEHILQAAKRSRDITRQLLAFASKQIINPKLLDLNAAVESMLKMLRNLLGENIDLRWQPKEGLWQIRIDPSQLDQVLANLCINARDAITNTGKMTIETYPVSLDEDYCKDHPGLIFGNYVVLSVTDNGCGMNKEVLDNVFEPFFTTKQTGESTGLGMATVYGIVKQSGGFINVYSEPNLGTTITIYFPRCEGEDVVSQVTTISDIQKGQGETVLLVEDELAIVKLATAILEDLGYRVLPANSPVEAFNLLKEFQGDIQLLLTDVVMPEMNGRELTQKIRKRHPKMKVLYMSGYTANIIAHHGVLDEGINFIQKPFSRCDLSIRIREILDSNA